MYCRSLFIFLLSCTAILSADDIKTFAGPKELPQQPTVPPVDPDLPPDVGDEKVILPETKVLILVSNPDLVEKRKQSGLERAQTEGVVYKELDVPGGEKKLTKRLEPIFLNQPLTKKKINQLKNEIISYYREQHHPVMMIFVPEQDATNGVFQLVIIESRVGQICVKGNHYTSTNRILRAIRLKPGDRIDDARLLQDVSWINMNPYRSANILFSPGEALGTTDVQVRVVDRHPWRIYAGGDNTGSPHIGEARWFTGVNFANAFFPENLFSFQFTTSSDFHKFKSYTGQYVARFPWRNTLSIFGGLAYVNPNLPLMKSHGKSYQVSGRYEVPIWPTYPTYQQQMTVGYDFKGSNNNIVFGLDNTIAQSKLANISQFVLGYHIGVEKWRQLISGDLEVFYSPCATVPHQSTQDFHALNPNATPKYIYGKLDYTHQAPLPGRWVLKGRARLQLSDNSLLASEQFAVGGYNTVRGYLERVVNGDNAVCLNLELLTPSFNIIPKIPQNLCYFYGFFDYGHAWDHKKIPGLPLSQTLIGVGPGVRYHIGSYFNLRFEVGFPLHKIETSSEKTRVHFSAVLSY